MVVPQTPRFAQLAYLQWATFSNWSWTPSWMEPCRVFVTSLGCGRAMGSFGLPHTATGALPRAEEVVFYHTYACLRSGTVSIAVLRATSRS